jgi:hypothetical protein
MIAFGRIDTYSLYITVFQPKIIDVSRHFADSFELAREVQWYPHMTIFRYFWPGMLFSEEGLLGSIADHAAVFDYLPIKIDGFFRLREGNSRNQAIAHRVIPSEEFVRFCEPLSRQLFHYSVYPPNVPIVRANNHTDLYPKDKKLHITVAWHLSQTKAEKIWEDLDDHPRIRPVKEVIDILRLTLSKNNAEYAEYDFPRRIWLFGEDMYSDHEWDKTYDAYNILAQKREGPI